MELVFRDATMISMRKGFTLLEIMVAVAIMIIISGASLASFTFSQRKSRDARRKGDLSQISKALQVFNEDFGRYPIGDSGNVIGCKPSAVAELEACIWGDTFSAYSGGVEQLYMSKLPEDPKVGYAYYYVSDGDNFSLYAILENDKDKDYRTDLTQECVTGVTCNYLLTEYGVEIE